MQLKSIGKETTDELRKNIPNFISPWQYKDSNIHIINLESVLSDITTNWNQDMRFRQGFAINEDKSLNLPTFFMQINGIYDDKNKYRKFIDELETKQTIRIKETKGMFTIRFNVDIDELFDNEGKLNKKYLQKLDCKFSSVNESMEKMLYQKLEEFYKKYPKVERSVYSKIISLNEKYLDLLHNFDYCFSNPKILVENMDDSNFVDSDKYVLIFLYSLGFDILIFSPKGHKFLNDYKINSVTLDRYLSNSEEIFDYRDDKVIEKEENEIKKQEKKKEKEIKNKKRKKKFKENLLVFIIVTLVLAVCGAFGYLIYYEETLSETAKMERYTNGLTFTTPTDTVYVNVDKIDIYKYPKDDSPLFDENSGIVLEKHDELERIAWTDYYSKFKTSSGTYFYLKNSDIRENYYSRKIENFTKEMIAPNTIQVYQFTNTKDSVYFTYEKDDTVTIIGYTDDFYQVKDGAKVGFIEKESIKENIEIIENTEVTETEPLSGWDIFLICVAIFCIIVLIFLLITPAF